MPPSNRTSRPTQTASRTSHVEKTFPFQSTRSDRRSNICDRKLFLKKSSVPIDAHASSSLSNRSGLLGPKTAAQRGHPEAFEMRYFPEIEKKHETPRPFEWEHLTSTVALGQRSAIRPEIFRRNERTNYHAGLHSLLRRLCDGSNRPRASVRKETGWLRPQAVPDWSRRV
jgi:hypothetical protein